VEQSGSDAVPLPVVFDYKGHLGGIRPSAVIAHDSHDLFAVPFSSSSDERHAALIIYMGESLYVFGRQLGDVTEEAEDDRLR